MGEKAFYLTVQNGRLHLDEPAEGLPEGKRLRVVVVDEEEDPQLTDEERAHLNATLDQSRAEFAAGKRYTWEEVKANALARRP